MDASGQASPSDEVRGSVPAVPVAPAPAPVVPVVPASAVSLAVVEATCAMPPAPDVARRRFWQIVVPSAVVATLAWVALIVWGGVREMRRGLLTGGPALMSEDTMAGHAHGAPDTALAALGLPDDPSALLPDGGAQAGHSMAMLGFDMGGLAPASVGYASLFVWMWTVMVVAMMLPATLPSVRVFLAGDRTRHVGAGLSFLGGCIATWAVAGLAVYGVLTLLDLALAEPAAESRFALGVGAAFLLAAGLFQFSRSKQRLLGHVRGPFNCGTGTLRAGLHHGRRCLASCGPYMLAVALIGMMSIFWMALFAVVMLVEQVAEMVAAKGMVVARSVGAVTVLVAFGLFLSPTPLPLVG